MYKDIKAYLYVNMRMRLCVSMQTHQSVHTKTHEHIYGCVRSQHIRCNTIFTEFRGWKLKTSEDFVWRTHILLLDPRDSHVALLLRMTLATAFTLLRMCILPYLRITTLPLMAITTTPTFSHINPDVQSAKFNKNSDEYHARTYIYSDEKRKTARIILPLILQASYWNHIYSICPTICILSSG